MATATKKKAKSFDHEGAQRKVRHPLQTVRRIIRVYILLEAVALTALFVSLAFWLGLAFDFGLASFDLPYICTSINEALPKEWTPEWVTTTFDVIGAANVHGVDWVQELNEFDTTSVSSRGIRIILLTVVVVGLLALGVMKVVVRWAREFNDRAVALVIEKRFHKELGDRLITAIELADPKLSKKYGYSQAMLEKAIGEAATIMQKLPVASVFNWKRLILLWFLVGFTTLGFLVANVIIFLLGSLMFSKETIDPLTFSFRFYDTAAIVTERNVLMMNTYWPRRAHLEVVRFQPSREPGKDTEMRVAKDDARPDLQVRAIEWVIADRNAPSGWRALTWKDLSERGLIDQAMLDGVKIPVEFKDWKIDPEELEPNLVAALFGSEVGPRTSASLREHFAQPVIAKKIEDRKEKKSLERWLDWHEWTMDKLAVQLEDNTVTAPLRGLRGGADYKNLEAIFDELKRKSESPMMSRTLRRLGIPNDLEVSFWGAEYAKREPLKGSNRTFSIMLGELKETSKFRVRGENFYTERKTIALVPAPQPAEIHIDKEEPAYLYHRLPGVDQTPLRGLKHRTARFPIHTTGDMNSIEVPLGANLVIHVKTDRKLHPEKAVYPKESSNILEPGFVGFQGKMPTIDPDYTGFRIVLNDVTKNQEFAVEFFDDDGIKGKRRFRVQRVLDTEPQLGALSLADVSIDLEPESTSEVVVLRTPKIKAAKDKPAEEKDKKEERTETRDQGELMNARLITPDAYLPLQCSVKDDYGLVRVGYHYKVRPVHFDFSPTPKKVELDPAVQRAFARLIVSNFQFRPEVPLSTQFGAFHIASTFDKMSTLIGYREAFVPSEGFADVLERERRKGRMAELDAIKASLTKGASMTPMEFDFKDDRGGFDLQRYMKELKNVDLDKAVQLHYYLQIAVQASDNRVESEKFVDEDGFEQVRGADYVAYVRADNPTLEVGPVVPGKDGKPVYLDEKGNEVAVVLKTFLGNTKTNKNGYLKFLVVSEEELLSQIAIEEEELYQKLETAQKRLDESIATLDAQKEKLLEKDFEMEPVLFRMNEIRTTIAEAGTALRVTKQAYRNIRKELKINRVKNERSNKIADRIYFPIRDILERDDRRKGTGSFLDCESAFQESIQAFEEDSAAKRRPSFPQHSPLMRKAKEEMQRLADDINGVLIAMSDGLQETAVINLFMEVERRHKRQDELLKKIYEKAVLDLFGGDPKDPPAPKKSSSLDRPAPQLQLDWNRPSPSMAQAVARMFPQEPMLTRSNRLGNR